LVGSPPESSGVQWSLADSSGLTITFRTAAIMMPNRRCDDHHPAIITPLPLSSHHPPTFPATTPHHKRANMMEHGTSSA